MSIAANALQWSIGLIGYGEVGRILAEDLRHLGLAVAACDLKVDTADAGLFGTRGSPGFARSTDWRTEADRIIAAAKAKGLK